MDLQLQFGINRSAYIRGLCGIASTLLFFHLGLALYNYRVDEVFWYLLQLFDLDEEHNLPTFYSGFLLTNATFLLWLNLLARRAVKDTWSSRWALLFYGFCFMTIDEIAGIHESINSVTDISWAWGGLVIVLLGGSYFIPFLLKLPVSTRVGFFVSGMLYLSGAIGLEFIGEPMDSDSLIYYLATFAEEGLEMFGVILFIYHLLGYMAESESLDKQGKR